MICLPFWKEPSFGRQIDPNRHYLTVRPGLRLAEWVSSETCHARAAGTCFEKMLITPVSTLDDWSNRADAISSISLRLALNSAFKSPVSPSDEPPSH